MREKRVDKTRRVRYITLIESELLSERSVVMAENEKILMETIAAAVGHMSEFEKGYFLGVAETRVAEKAEKEAKETQAPA